MKTILLLLMFTFNSICFAQTNSADEDSLVEPTALTGDFKSVPPDSARHHVDELITVCGIVTEVYSTAGATTLINFGKTFPDYAFTAVIMAKDTANFKEFYPFEKFEGLKVCVTGTIKIYKDKPQIILKAANQVRIPPQESIGK